MKKNISINISGIIFHIEEDGYEILQNYLNSIDLYFSRFDDSKEIVDDIENRIAEIFLGKISPSKQVITLDDVNNLVSTMGTVEDFAAIEDAEEPLGGKAEPKQEHAGNAETADQGSVTRRLYRNTGKKVLGGVASGIANHFNIDPMWVRLLFVLLVLSAHSLGLKPLEAFIVITYIVLWIILPGSSTVEENRNIKKLYRNPDDKVLGGVASGMAAYFGTDPLAFRILFVLTIFMGGAGFIIYIVFWIITPEAKSITDKIQMKGDPVTLSSIENNVKKNFNLEEEENESTFVKIILLPFRIISGIFTGIGKILEPLFRFLVEAIRIVFGVTLFTIGIVFLITLIIVSGYALGLYNGEDYFFAADVPLDILISTFPPYAIFLLFVVLFVPFLAVILAGISVVRNKNIFSSTIGWSLFALWVLSLLAASSMVPNIISNLRSKGVIIEHSGFH